MKSPGAFAATSLVVASMVGTGAFTSLGYQLFDLDSGPQILLLWLLGGVIALCGALCYAAIARALPQSGGEHHFLGELYHPSLGFMAGILSAISGFAAPTAITAMAFGAYLHSAIPSINATSASLLVILAGTVAHMASATTSARVQTAATGLKLVLILAFLVAAVILPGEGDIQWSIQPTHDFDRILQPGFAISLIYVLYAYSGWNAAVYGLEEWKEPAKTVRRALIIGTLLVTVLYIALQAAFLSAAPVDELRGVIEIGHVAATSLFGETAAQPVAGLFALGLFASVSAMLWAGPRVLAAMGRTTPSLAFLVPRSGVPRIALYVQMALALTLVASTGFASLITYTLIGLTVSTMLTVGGIFILHRRTPGQISRTLFIPATIFLAMTGFIVVRSIITEPIPSLIGLATVVVTAVLWFPLHRTRS
ncbi:MAG: APC family permease [Haloferula sp.]